jgi:hypothetical protein
MLMAIAGAVVGFVAGVMFAMFFPLGLYWQRLLFRLGGPSRFEIDGKEYLLGPDDTLHWDVAENRPRE